MSKASINEGIFTLIAQSEEGSPLRASMFSNLSALRKVGVEVLEGEFSEFEKENKDKLEKAARAVEREARKARVEILIKEVDGLNLQSEGLGDLITRVEIEGGFVSLNSDLSLKVTLAMPKTHKGGTGKPPAWRPAAFRDMEGDRVYGALTDWAKENLSETDQKAKGCFRPNGKFRSGASLGKALIKSETLIASPVSEEEMATAVKAANAAKAKVEADTTAS